MKLIKRLYDELIKKGVKSGITYVISHNYAKIKVDSYDSLALEKTLTLHNVITLIKLTFLKELMLIRQANEKSVICVTIGIFR